VLHAKYILVKRRY